MSLFFIAVYLDVYVWENLGKWEGKLRFSNKRAPAWSRHWLLSSPHWSAVFSSLCIACCRARFPQGPVPAICAYLDKALTVYDSPCVGKEACFNLFQLNKLDPEQVRQLAPHGGRALQSLLCLLKNTHRCHMFAISIYYFALFPGHTHTICTLSMFFNCLFLFRVMQDLKL